MSRNFLGPYESLGALGTGGMEKYSAQDIRLYRTICGEPYHAVADVILAHSLIRSLLQCTSSMARLTTRIPMNSRSDWPRQVPLAGRRGIAESHAGMPTHPSCEAVRTRRLTGSSGKTAAWPKWDWSRCSGR